MTNSIYFDSNDVKHSVTFADLASCEGRGSGR